MNTSADLDAMRFHANAAHEHRIIVLARIRAALEAEKRPKPKKPKCPYLFANSWAATVNNPIPEHVKEFAASKNPLHNAVTIKLH